MLPFRVLAPFLFIAGGSVLVVVFTLLIMGNSTDQQARKGLHQQLQYAFLDQQQRVQQQADQLLALHENLPAYSFMQVLHYQLDQQCLLWLAENSVNYQGRCSEESMLTPALLHQMELSREPVGLRGNSPTFFYHYHEPALFMRHS